MSRISFAIITSALLLGCHPESINQPADHAKSIVQGTISYFEGGGTVEMIYPPGFILMSPQWITQPPDSPYGRIYLAGIVDSSAVGRHVRAVGTASRTILTGSPPSYKFPIITFQVDSLKVTD